MSSHRRRASKQPDQRPEDDDRSRLLAGKERRLDEPAVDQHVRPVGQPDRDQASQHPLDRSLEQEGDRKSTRLNSSHSQISYAVFCLKKKKKKEQLKSIAQRDIGETS